MLPHDVQVPRPAPTRWGQALEQGRVVQVSSAGEGDARLRGPLCRHSWARLATGLRVLASQADGGPQLGQWCHDVDGPQAPDGGPEGRRGHSFTCTHDPLYPCVLDAAPTSRRHWMFPLANTGMATASCQGTGRADTQKDAVSPNPGGSTRPPNSIPPTVLLTLRPCAHLVPRGLRAPPGGWG